MKTTDAETDQWLKANGINPKTFASVQTLLLQAQRAAYRTLKSYGDLLTDTQLRTLNHFRLAMMNGTQRRSLSARYAYQILNIAAKINRKVFAQRRKALKHKKTYLMADD